MAPQRGLRSAVDSGQRTVDSEKAKALNRPRPRPRNRNRLFSALLSLRLASVLPLLSASHAATAGEELVPVRQSSVLVAPLVSAAPKIDGVLADAVWQTAQPLRDFAYKTKAVRCQTVGWLCRDAANLYFAARCFDDNLGGLVTEFEGGALWKNDCIELFVVPEKKDLFFAHLVISCDGRANGSTWVPDEWGEPTRGDMVKMTATTGREKDAWTMELSVPIAAFGHPITPQSVWALGFNREKHSDAPEVSSFQGGFNRPREYPDLVFDDRALVVDGVGIRNLGKAAEAFTLAVGGGKWREETSVTLAPGQRVPLNWKEGLVRPEEGDEFSFAAQRDGKTLLGERYVLAAPAKRDEPVNLAKIPPPKFVRSPLDDPSFFPVSVWVQPAGQAAKYKAMGVNVYVGGVDSYPRPKDREFLDAIRSRACGPSAPTRSNTSTRRCTSTPPSSAGCSATSPTT